MSPGKTMMRVYGALKTRILAGEFAPGERLDPARLAPGLGTSRTPVRDALHRLSGERLVETWEDEGFRQPIVSEVAIRDLYEWSGDVLHAALRAAGRRRLPVMVPAGLPPDAYGDATARCFLRVASLSSNLEYRAAISGLNDRSALLRLGEVRALEHALRDVLAIEAALAADDLPAIGRAVDQYFRRRLRAVAEIAAALRPRDHPDS